ncbi:MAG: acyl transferase domain-containing protein/NADPH:quinone reductase-like Zn-dependent oxidoreductase, partial [Myxococcota bacterium]
TVCSSSLVALHLAVRALRAGECDRALVGGVHALLAPDSTLYLCQLGALAPDGRSKTFDASADGYGRGEGCGVLTLRPLADAQAAGDPILAVVRGTAVNHDGRSAGLTVPSAEAQQAVIRAALADGGVAPAEVSYLECHGTGTSLGDPIEVRAAGTVYAEGRPDDGPLQLGSVKANIGHLEAAAGVAGLIKLVLVLEHGETPPNALLTEVNPALPVDTLPLSLPVTVLPWHGPRMGAVSSFGLSGTNAHAVVEAAPAGGPPPHPSRAWRRRRFWAPSPWVQTDRQRRVWSAAEAQEHRVHGRPAAPAAWAVEALLAGTSGALAEVVFGASADLSADVAVERVPGPRLELSSDQGVHATARSVPLGAPPSRPTSQADEAIDIGALYDAFAERGLTYGLAHRVIRAAWRGDAGARAELAAGSFSLLLDGALQCLALTRSDAPGAIPVGVDQVHVWNADARVAEAYVHGDDVLLVDAAGPVAWFVGVRTRSITRGALYRVAWREADEPEAGPGEVWAVPSGSPESRLAAALEWARSRTAPRVTVVGPASDPGVAAVFGFIRSVRRERPEIAWHLVDGTEEDAAREGGQEPEVRWQDGVRGVPRLVLAEDAGVVPHGVVWITGGLSGIGAALARWLAPQVDALWLTGRRGLDTPGADALLDTLRRSCPVEVRAWDVCAPIPEPVPADWVVHAAGVRVDGRLDSLTAEDLSRALAPKLTGLRNVVAAAPAASVVALSSVAGVTGSAGQAAYSAANAALDAAVARIGGTSFASGPWTVGLTADLTEAQRARQVRLGLRPLVPWDGVQLVARAWGGGAVIGADLDLGAVATSQNDPLFAELAPAAGSGDLPRLGTVRAAAAAALGRTPTDLPDDVPLHELGLDSLGALELRGALGRIVGRQLPATFVLEHPTVAGMLAALGPLAPTVIAASAGASPDDPIAIVGMACRFPGADSPEAFWQLIHDGVDATSEVPADRWDASAVVDPVPGRPGRTDVLRAGFLADVAGFDAEFFGMSGAEAAALDPQQRLLLEVAWEAVERARWAPDRMDARTGVFVGIADSQYGDRVDLSVDDQALYALTGNDDAFAAGRVAHALGLRGPTLAVDTLCSSSLVALHLAVAALRKGECDRALVAGVHTLVSPDGFVILSQLGALAADGRCKSFDARADGFGRGEGCGVLALRRLSDARAAGDPVLAVVRGTAVNHDGRTAGLTVPSASAQQEVLRAALSDAHTDAAEVAYLECHGTGTALGDPVEARAAAAVYGRDGAPPALGSVKANIGHLEAAAGVAGVIKVVLALQHGVVPPNALLDQVNPAVPTDRVRLPIAPEPWAGARVAAVSAFGLSGTNAHAVLGLADPPPVPPAHRVEGPWLLVTSGRTLGGLKAWDARIVAWTAGRELGSVAASVALTRAHGRVRRARVIHGAEDLEAPTEAPLEPRRGPVAWVGTDIQAQAQWEAWAGPPDQAAVGADTDIVVCFGDASAPSGPAAVVRVGDEPLHALAKWYSLGRDIHWNVVFHTSVVVDLPTTPWQHKRHWLPLVHRGGDPTGDPFLGRRLDVADGACFRARWAESALPWLADHRVGGRSVVPAAAIVEALRRAVGDGYGLVDISLERPIFAGDTVQVAVREAVATVHRRDGSEWQRSATAGVVERGIAPAAPAALSGTSIETAELVARLEVGGLVYGPRFRAVQGIVRGSEAVEAELILPVGVASDGLAPALLDGALQLTALLPDVPVGVPFQLGRVRVFRLGVDRARVTVRRSESGVDAVLWDDAGVIAQVTGLRVREIGGAGLQRLAWGPVPAEPVTGTWAVRGWSALAEALGGSVADAETLPTVANLVLTWPSGVSPPIADAVALVRSALALDPVPRLWFLTRGAVDCDGTGVTDLAGAGLWGLGRSVAVEHPELHWGGVDAESVASAEQCATALRGAGSGSCAFRDGVWLRSDLVPAGPRPLPRSGFRLTASGASLDDLVFEPTPRRPAAAGEVEIRIRAGGLNFRDVLTGLGMYPGEPIPLGAECAGVVERAGAGVDLKVGTRVLALASGFRRFVTVDARVVAPIPAALTDSTAAAVPVAFLTALYALRHLADVQPGDRVLVHAAAGGVGQAAVQVARMLGAEVLGTASPEKQATLRALGVAWVGNSRDLSFVDTLRPAGPVDVVLNALTGPFVDASLSLLRPGGWFLEMGKTDVRTDVSGVRYLPFDLQEAGPEAIGAMLRELVDHLAAGRLTPLPVRSWPMAAAPDAFRFMSQARHIGKLVLRLPHLGGTVLITGGLGAVGAAIARHLRGHRLVLVGRRGEETPGALALLAELPDARVEAVDITDPVAVAALVAKHAPTAVVHAAGVLDDGMLTGLTPERIEAVLAPKVAGAWALHQAVGDVSAFVLVSSVAGVLGSAGQSAYAAANAWLDGLAAHRRGLGLAGTSIAWGPWTEGMGAEHVERMRARGLVPLDPGFALAQLDDLLERPESGLVGLGPGSRVRGIAAQEAVDPGLELEDRVRAEVARVLGLRVVPVDRPLAELGLDSLQAVELRNALSRVVGRRLPATLAFDHPTVLALVAALTPSAPVAAPMARRTGAVPIAIVGAACRLPGDVNSLDDLWALLAAGGDAVGPPPPGRDGRRPGGYLTEIADFDAMAFDMSDAEARALDPQHRLLLEVSQEALASAGLVLSIGSDTGVFVGVGPSEYGRRFSADDPAAAFAITGNDPAFAAGRVAWQLGACGPAITVQTMCSSSLVAVCEAVEALRRGACTVALAGGANALVDPSTTELLAGIDALSPTGRCRTFDAGADGYVRAEGCGVVVLQRLDDALAAGLPVLAVLRGAAVNHDGRSAGLTVPSGPAQEAVLRAALADAGIGADDVGYLECHGSGTPLGDPIEVRAADSVYGEREGRLLIGSVKSNLGHLEAAAGIAGLLKAVAVLRSGRVPRQLHLTRANPELPDGALEVVAEECALDAATVAVSSFGLSGTNAHVVLERAPDGATWPAGPPPVWDHRAVWAEPSAVVDRALLSLTWEPRPSSGSVARRWGVVGLPELADALRTSGVEVVVAADLASLGPVDIIAWHGPLDPLLCTTRGPLVVVTERGRSVHGEAPAMTEALLGGAVRALQSDRPDLSIVQLDHDGDWATVVQVLRSTELSEWAESVHAVRHGQRLVPRLVRAGGVASVPAQGTWLVTGGTGALGRWAAEWLAGRGVRSIVLAGRRPPGPAALAVQARLERRGVVVGFCTADVSNAAGVEGALAACDAMPAPLVGLLHLAGVYEAGAAADHDPAQLERVLGPKLGGAQLLDAATRDRDLSAFVLFGSAVAQLGGAGQAAYVIANAGLEAVAASRRAAGLAGVCIGWGPWSTGMAAVQGDAHASALEALGIRPITPWLADAVLERALMGPPQVVAIRLDPSRMPTVPPLLERLSSEAGAPASSVWVDGLRGLSATARVDAVTREVSEQVAMVLQARPPAPDTLLVDVGLDSLLATDLRGRLQALVGRPLAATLAFDHPTVGQIAACLLQEVGLLSRVVAVAPTRSPGDEPIAIVGMSCRFPGASSPEALWELVRSGGDATGPAPDDRWAAGSAPTRGGYLQNIADFDAAFFGLSEGTALAMDPQHRLVLEVAWEAVERAGWRDLADTATGVFLGLAASEYSSRLAGAPESALLHGVPGNQPSFAAGRVSHLLGLTGPTLVVDTACSSSLVALHLAVESLRRGECVRALVGGVNAIVDPGGSVMLARAGALSADGRCKTFDASADGYGRAEGCGVVALRRLSDARAAGDTVLAVVRGSAVNHDGRSAGLTVPSADAQEAVIRAALASAGVEPADVDVLECHGTGTALGDPIEVGAAGRVYGAGRPDTAPLLLGSVKANLGHLEAAAGIAGVIRTVLSVGRGEVAPNAQLNRLNPALPLVGVALPRALRAWPERGARLAGVSAFGLSGTNAHVIIEGEPTDTSDTVPDESDPTPVPTRQWQHRRYWLPHPTPSRGPRTGPGLAPVDLSVADWAVEGTLGTAAHPWLRDHVVAGVAVVPAAAIVDLLWSRGPVADLVLQSPVRVDESSRIQAIEAGDRWMIYAGDVSLGLAATARPGTVVDATPDLAGARTRCTEAVDVAAMYAAFSGVGVDYGPAFRTVERLWRGESEAVAALSSVRLPGFAVSPMVVDGALQALAAASGVQTAEVPFAIAHAWVVRPGVRVAWAHARSGDSGADVDLLDEEGALVAALRGVRSRPIALGVPLHVRRWVRRPTPTPEASVPGRVVRFEPHASVQALCAHALAEAQAALREPAGRVWWVTVGAVDAVPSDRPDPALAAVLGLARSLAAEHPALGVALVDVDDASRIDEVLRHESADPLREVAWRDGQRLELSWQAATVSTGRLTPGATLDALSLVPHPTGAPGPGQVAIDVVASGLNFRDVLLALGTYAGAEAALGSECAGRVAAVGAGVDLVVGQPVMALAQGVQDRVVVDRRLVHPVPDGVPLAVAACVPVAFATAWVALHDLADVQPGERVLVHAAAGGVGMAAVQVARHLGAEVVATASPPKWPILRELGIAEIASSRDAGFAEAFGRVDVVLDALVGPLVDAGLSLLGPGGRFIELGKADVRSAATVAAEHPGVRYRAFDLWEAGPDRLGEILREVHAGLVAGWLTPLPLRTFPVQRASDAFRFMARAGHVGKLALLQSAPPRFDGLWVVSGGTGALGLAVAGWLRERGVGELLLLSRRGPEAPGAMAAAALGAEVLAVDVEDAAAVARALSGRRIQGVVHAAGVLDDGPVEGQTAARSAAVVGPKLGGAWALHEATVGSRLDAFVLFGSLAGSLGAPGQSTYAAANAGLEALAVHRRRQGLPATCIAWGPWTVGMAARSGGAERSGLRPITPEGGLAALDAALRIPEAVVLAGASSASLSPTRAPSAAQITAPDTVRQVVARVLSRDPADLPEAVPLQALGLDSLVAIELRNALAELVGRPLPASLAFDHPTVGALVAHLTEPRSAAARPAESRHKGDDSIAIIGMACRFPGGSTSPEAYWELLVEGRDAIGPVPADRWSVADWYHPEPGTPGKTTSREGGFVDGITAFDAAFFGMSELEALALDPQQRLLLEVSWEALQRSGRAPGRLAGTDAGVFFGLGRSEYGDRFALDHPAAVYAVSGSEPAFAAGRVAHLLGVTGPALVVDTLCSSSLVAVHQAVQSLRAGGCGLALAGGANALVSPTSSVLLSQMRALSPTDRCRVFDASADGYVRGEGAAVVVLRRLSDALADGDRVLAVIRGSSVNHDGRSSGLTTPNGSAQEAVLRAALGDAGLTGADIDLLECHGTGTPLGDPIEVRAAAAVYGGDLDRPVQIGSVKSNLGHLEAAAGAAGLVKAVLALQHGIAPPTLHVHTVNPEVVLAGLTITTAAVPLPSGVRRAAVSSFGLSGTNAHLVLESAPPVQRATAPSGPSLLLVSGRSTADLAERVRGLPTDAPVGDVAHTLARSEALPHRVAVVAADMPTAVTALLAEVPDEVAAAPRVAWVFPGQGAVRPGMGMELYREDVRFREVVDRCDAQIRPALGCSVLEVWQDPVRLRDTTFAQPALFVLGIGLAERMRAWGFAPDAVAGHSVGELVAAWVAGVWSLEDALRVVLERGRLMGRLPAGGAMVAVGTDEATARAAIAEEDVSIAAVNADDSVVLSGSDAAVQRVVARLSDIPHRPLTVSHAFHSARMDPVLSEFEAFVHTVPTRRPRIRLVSSMTGVREDSPDARYWREHVRRPVRWADAVQALEASGVGVVVELGAVPVLTALGARTADSVRWVPTLRRARSESEALLETAASLFMAGVDGDWPAVCPGALALLMPAPFHRRPAWAPLADTAPEALMLAVEWTAAPAAGPPRPRSLQVVGSPELVTLLQERGLSAVGVPSASATGEAVWLAPDTPQLLAAGGRTNGPTWLVTEHAQRGGSAPAQAATWGFARSMALERPELDIRLIDTHDGLKAVADRIAADTAVPACVVQADVAWVPGLAAARLEPAPAIRADRSYWITGASGALGQRIAAHLVRRGARHLVLSSRSITPDAGAALVAQGVDVQVIRGDMAEVAHVDAVIAGVRAPLAGVIHAAGVLDDALVADLSPERVAAVLRPKADAVGVLDAATRQLDLELFVLFSSLAGVVGSPGQSPYAAANAVLDAVAARRRADGLPAVSIAWGPWSGGGMAAGVEARLRDRLAIHGWAPLTPGAALAAFDRALGGPSTVVVVAAAEAAVSALPDAVPSSVVDRIVRLPHDERADAVREHLTGLATAQLRRDLDPSQPLWDQGMDSLMAIELRNALGRAGVLVPLARVIGGPSLDDLTAIVLGELESRVMDTDPPASDPGLAPLSPVVSHVMAAVGGGLLTGVVLWMAWQLWSSVGFG